METTNPKTEPAGAAVAGAVLRRPRAVVYPVRDGKPMAETDKHADIMVYGKEALRLHFAPRAHEVYVSGNNFVFWKEGDPKKRVSPDIYVVFGVAQRQRDSFQSWKEDDLLPSVVIEITSRKTQTEDVNEKRVLYQNELKTPEYFQFDPTGDYLHPRLQGLRRDAMGTYQPIPLENGDRLWSEQLRLYLVMQNDYLRLLDPATGQILPTLAEESARRAAAEGRAETAEAEAERLRAEIEALRRLLSDGA